MPFCLTMSVSDIFEIHAYTYQLDYIGTVASDVSLSSPEHYSIILSYRNKELQSYFANKDTQRDDGRRPRGIWRCYIF